MDKEIRDSWIMPNWECCKRLSEYMELAIPSTIMLCAEFWTFELVTLQAGYLSINEMGANVIVLNTDFLMFMYPVALSSAATALIGKAVGKGNE